MTATVSPAVAKFLKGALYAPQPEAVYPRIEAEKPISRAPRDTWAAACLPVGVRLEFEGDVKAVELRYRCHEPVAELVGTLAVTRQLRPTLQPRFELWDRERLLDSALADPKGGSAILRTGAPGPYTLYLPELALPEILQVGGIGADLRARPARRRWIAYGDSITEGWCASSPALCWPSRVARELDLEMANLGFSGAARGEPVLAEMIARQRADLISLSFGTNCWARIAHSAGLFAETVASFFEIVRTGHPTTPILCISPTLRPDAEDKPNARDLPFYRLRDLFEAAVGSRIKNGDTNIHLLPGRELIDAADLVDEVHPNDEGHGKIAAAVVTSLGKILG